MKLSKNISRAVVEIRQPRWHDRRVLIAKFRVKEHNEIHFTQAPTLEGKFYLSGETIKKYPLVSNGKIACYAVHLDELEALEDE